MPKKTKQQKLADKMIASGVETMEKLLKDVVKSFMDTIDDPKITTDQKNAIGGSFAMSIVEAMFVKYNLGGKRPQPKKEEEASK